MTRLIRNSWAVCTLMRVVSISSTVLFARKWISIFLTMSNYSFKPQTVGCILRLLGLSGLDRWFEAAKFSRGCRVAAALTSDKVTPIAVVEVFAIWITGIIPLLFDNNVTWVWSDLYSDVIVRSGSVCAVHTEMMVLPVLCILVSA